MKNLYILLTFFALMNTAIGQEEKVKYFELGIEVQQYPTGNLSGIRGEVGLANHHALDFRAGYNALDHKDFGVHNTEVGGGFGGSVGYRYYFNPANEKWFAGIRTDLWFNEVDWTDPAPNSPIPVKDVTNVVVLQPTVIGGYRWAFGDHFAITPTAAFGAEINIVTDGEEVGQGFILLLGVSLTYRF